MSARDSASGSSTYKGGSGGAGGLGNGGVGGGMSSGSRGGGAGYNGGAGSRTGMTTGAEWKGNTAFGRPGGNAVAYGMRDAASLRAAGMGPTVGSFGNFRTPSGAAMFGNSPVQGQSFYGMNMGQALSQAQRAQARQPASVAGLLGGSPVAAGAPAYPAVEQEMALPAYEDVPVPEETIPAPPTVRPASLGWLPGWPGTGQWWGNQGPWNNNKANWPGQGVPGTRSSGSTNDGYPSLNSQDSRPAGVY